MAEIITCAVVQERLVALLDGELSPSEAAILRTHIAECQTCEREYNSLVRVGVVADSWHVPAPSILRRLEAEIPDVRAAIPKRAPVSATVREVLNRYDRTRRPVASIMVEMGIGDDVETARFVAEAQNLPFIDLRKHKPETEAIRSLPGEIALRHRILPIRRDGQTLFVAAEDLQDRRGLDAVETATRCMVRPLAATPADLDRCLREAYGREEPVDTQEDVTATLLTELRGLREEFREARNEITTLRTEVTALREQLATRPRTLTSPVRTVSGPHLMPYVSSSDTPSLLS